MNNQIVLQDVVSMTSREIATLVESRHADVKRSIERLMTNAVISKAPTAFLEEISNLGLPIKREVYIFSGEQGMDQQQPGAAPTLPDGSRKGGRDSNTASPRPNMK